MHVNLYLLFLLAATFPANSEPFTRLHSAATKRRSVFQRWKSFAHDFEIVLKQLSRRQQVVQQFQVTGDEVQHHYCTLSNPLDGLNSGSPPSNSSPSTTTFQSQIHHSSSSSAPQPSSSTLSLYNLVESHVSLSPV